MPYCGYKYFALSVVQTTGKDYTMTFSKLRKKEVGQKHLQQ